MLRNFRAHLRTGLRTITPLTHLSTHRAFTTAHPIAPVLLQRPSYPHFFTTAPHRRIISPDALMAPKICLLAFSNHIWMQTTIHILSAHGIEVDVLIEEESTAAKERSKMWLDNMYERSRKPAVSQKLKQIENEVYKDKVNKSFTVKSINAEAPQILREHQPDVIILANCGIIQPEVIECSPICLNAHPALLKGQDGIRGALPFLRAIIQDKPLGVSVHHVVPEVDRGEIIVRKRITVQQDDGVGDIMFRILERQAEMIADLLKMEQIPLKGKANECTSRPFRWNNDLFEKAHQILLEERYSHWYSGVKE